MLKSVHLEFGNIHTAVTSCVVCSVNMSQAVPLHMTLTQEIALTQSNTTHRVLAILYRSVYSLSAANYSIL